jgi:hypothetical protein
MAFERYPFVNGDIMTAAQPHRILRALLFAISAIEGIAGLILLFASDWALSFAPAGLAFHGGFLLALVKAIGIVALALGYLLCAAARDPVRYIAVIDTLTFMLLAAAALSIYAVTVLHAGLFYPRSYLIVRAIVQIAIALALVVLRPKGESPTSVRAA